jgi:transcriptional regulator with XRE-family HTH domain
MVSQAEPKVGERIRTLREQQGYSLRALATLSGLSINAISLIERGANSPTVSSLQLLATALEVPITEFFSETQNQTAVFVTPSERLRSQVDGITMESLGIGLRNQQIDPFLLKVAPGKGSMDRPVSHPGEEFVYCLEGTIEYGVGGRIYNLEPGYSLLFEATMPHCFYNRQETPALLLTIFFSGENSHQGRRLHLTLAKEEDKNEDVN